MGMKEGLLILTHGKKKYTYNGERLARPVGRSPSPLTRLGETDVNIGSESAAKGTSPSSK